VQVEVRVVGGSVDVEPRRVDGPSDGPISLRALLDHVVRSEVAEAHERDRRRSFLRVLSPEALEHGVAEGRIRSGGRPPLGRIDADAAIATALESFEDGLLLVLVDSRPVEGLDATVVVADDTRVRFVRLTALAGG
jgi:hypothetical protein